MRVIHTSHAQESVSLPRVSRWRGNAWVALLATAAIVVLVNWIGGVLYFRLDLTGDKRYTLGRSTKSTLRSLHNPLYVKCYLGGDLPLDFIRLRQGVEELLEEYRVASRYRVEFQFIDPSTADSEQERRAQQAEFMRMGLQPVSVQEQGQDGAVTERIVFPALQLGYAGQTATIQCYRPNMQLSVPEAISLSLQGLEYELTAAIDRLTQPEKPSVALIHGHGELQGIEIADWRVSLAKSYQLLDVDTLARVGMLDECAFALIANPLNPFTEREKLVLDQYLVQGGSLLLALSPVQVSEDSLQQGSETLAYPRALNLDDLLFKQGIRMANALVQDAHCALLPVNTAMQGQAAQFTPLPWVYYPLLEPAESLLVTRNLNPIYSRFPSPIELTAGGSGQIRSVLLHSSGRCRAVATPRLVSLAEIGDRTIFTHLSSGKIPVAVAIEGKFTSLFAHRPVKAIAGGQSFDFKPQGEGGRLVVVADGSIVKNGVRSRGGKRYPLPLGFDRYTQQTFGNREFLDNLALYLSQRDDLLELRGRTLTLRLLDGATIALHRIRWQLVNMLIPTLLLLALGGILATARWVRFRKFGA